MNKPKPVIKEVPKEKDAAQPQADTEAKKDGATKMETEWIWIWIRISLYTWIHQSNYIKLIITKKRSKTLRKSVKWEILSMDSNICVFREIFL